jgi:hypothetical protein
VHEPCRLYTWLWRAALAADLPGVTLVRISLGRPLVLLCFERDRGDCHRGDFAGCWHERTGEVVPEVG